MTKKTTTLASVERDEKGRVKGGALNPGGFTIEEREARDALRKWLSGDVMRTAGKAAYTKALEDGNPAIIKDWADRMLGKVTEKVALEDADGNVVSPLAIMLAQYRALPTKAQEEIEKRLAEQAERDRETKP